MFDGLNDVTLTLADENTFTEYSMLTLMLMFGRDFEVKVYSIQAVDLVYNDFSIFFPSISTMQLSNMI